jgi:hypothetical protein
LERIMRKPHSRRSRKAVAMTNERWLAVPEWEGVYEVSDRGNVRRILKSGARRLLKPYRGSKGAGRSDAQYPRVNLQQIVAGQGRKTDARVHLLVWRAFRGDVPEALEVNHRDLNRDNAALSNLELLTRKGNQAHRAENHPDAIRAPVRARLRALAPKHSRAEMARRFKVSEHRVRKAVADIPGPFTRAADARPEQAVRAA